MSPNDPLQLIDDANIIGGSPTDRVIGMLLERTEAIRELHESMRTEFRGLIDTHADIKNMMGRIVERQDHHEKNDAASFAAVNANHLSIISKIDNLGLQINTATTASVIQKAQFNAGWKVIVYIGVVAMAVITIFSTFFNHNWK